MAWKKFYIAVWAVCLIYWLGVGLDRFPDNFSLYRCDHGICKLALVLKEALEVPVFFGLLAASVIFLTRLIKRVVSFIEVLIAFGAWSAFIYNLSFIRS